MANWSPQLRAWNTRTIYRFLDKVQTCEQSLLQILMSGEGLWQRLVGAT